MHATRSTVWLAWALIGAGCVPATSAYLRVPVRTDDGTARDRAVVHVPLAELAERMADFDPARVAFYHRGREPVPHRLVDSDADGRPDAAQVAIPIAGNGLTRLIAVCPAEDRAGVPEPAEPDAGVQLQFDEARR